MFCENCGHKLEDGSAFCENCGVKIENELNFCESYAENSGEEILLSNICENTEPVESQKQKKQKGKIALIITSVVLSLAIIAGSIFILPKIFKKDLGPSPSSFNSYVYLDEGFTNVKIVDNKSAIKAVASVADVLGIKNPDEELSVADVNKFENETFYRIEQSYNGIPVYGKSISLACYKDGSSAALTSNYLTIPETLSTKPKKSLRKAKKAVKKYLDADNVEFEDTDDNLVIFETDSCDVVLAYYLNATNYGSFIIDANTAKVLSFSTHLNNASVEIYSSKDLSTKAVGTVEQTGKSSKKYSLYNSEYNISVFDIKGNSFNEGLENGGNIPDAYFDIGKKFNKKVISSKSNKFNHNAVVAFDAVIDISDYYKKLNFKGFDQIHVAINDGSYKGTNALGGSQIIDKKICSVISLGTQYDYNDISTIGHEYTHGVFGSFVIYQHLWTEPIDAINEGYADLFGVLIDAHLNNKKTPSWDLSDDRNVADPNSSGYPETMQDLSDAKTFEDTNNGNPMTFYNLKDSGENSSVPTANTNYSHFASTLISHSAYLMSKGIDGVSIDSNTLAKLWYKSIMLLQGTSDYSQCRSAVELTAKIMLKNGELTKEQCEIVSNAFDQVGIDKAVINYKYTVKNNFDLSVLVSDKNITLDSNSRLQSNFNLEVVNLSNLESAEKVLYKENISDKYSLELEDGYYGLIIRDAKADTSTPINIWIKVDNKNDNAIDEITLQTDFTATIVTKLQEKPSVSTSSTSSKPSDDSISQEEAYDIVCKYWESSLDSDNYSILYNGIAKGYNNQEYYDFRLRHRVEDDHWSVIDNVYVNKKTGELTLDIPTTPSTTTPSNNNDSQKQTTVYLKEIKSTGEILYKNFRADIFDCGNREAFHFYNEGGEDYLDSDLFIFYHEDKEGYADVHGNIVLDPIYTDAGWFFENKAIVSTSDYVAYQVNGIEQSKSREYMIIDTNGNELMTLPQGYTPKISMNGYEDTSCFKNGKALFCKRESSNSGDIIKVLTVNENMTTSEFVIEKALYSIRFINTPEFCGVLGVYRERKEDPNDYNDVYVLYDTIGEIIWQQAVSYVDYGSSKISRTIYNENGLNNIDGFVAKNGYMNIVDQNGKWGLLDLRTGNIKIACQYEYLGSYSDGLIEVCSYEKWGYIDINGNVIIKPAFLYATSFVNGRAFAEQVGNQFTVIDKKGNTVATYVGLGFTTVLGNTLTYEAVTPFTKSNGIAALTAGHQKFSLITPDGKKIHTVDDNSAMTYISNKYVFDGERMYEIVTQ